MSDFLALLMAQQNERELEIALERRRLLIETAAAQPRMRTRWGAWQRFRARMHRPAPVLRGSVRPSQ